MTSTDLMYDLETDIMGNLVKHLKKGNLASANWQMSKLAQLGVVNKSNSAIIGTYIKTISRETILDIEEAGANALKLIEPTFQKGVKAGLLQDALPANASPSIRKLLATFQKQAGEGTNYTLQTLLKNSGQVYVDTVNKTALKLLSGVATPDQALAETIMTWAKSGIPSIIDKAGRQWTTESYVNMLMRTNIRSITTEIQFTRCDEYDVDLIEVSSHSDARPGCAPYQGRIYSRNGKNKKYPSLSSTSMGEAAGLFGVNCRHNLYPFVEGLSTKRNQPDPNTEKAYADSQTQRRYETSIRKSKREVKLAQADGNVKTVKHAKDTLRNRQDGLNSFLKSSGRTRRSNRERIYNV